MAATATAPESIALVRQFNDDVFNGREYDRITDVRADDYVQHGPLPGQVIDDPAESLALLQALHGAFPDLEATEEFAFSDGELVCTHYIYRGTHDGAFMGMPPSGAEAEVRGTVINRIEDGKIAEAWIQVDLLGLFQAMGAIPSMDELAA